MVGNASCDELEDNGGHGLGLKCVLSWMLNLLNSTAQKTLLVYVVLYTVLLGGHGNHASPYFLLFV